MNEVALFETALRAAVPTEPDPMIGRELVPRLAAVARTATIEAETLGSRWGGARESGRGTPSRPALVARVGIAVGLIPVIFAGLAFAGVSVPGPARDAFDAVGVTLPNQPSEHSRSATQPQATGNDVSDAAKSANETKQGNSAAAHRHARRQHSKARGKAKGHSRGKAIGLNDLTPPGHSGQTGPPAHSNAGGSPRSHSVRSGPKPRPFPGRGRARGHSR